MIKMSRLYAWIENDKGQERTLRGHERIEARINYGSKQDSKLAVRVVVNWDEGDERPKVHIELAELLKDLTLKPNV